MKTLVESVKFAAVLTAMMLVAFLLHSLIVGRLMAGVAMNELLLYYGLNLIPGLLIGIVIIRLSVNRGELLGFAFMGGSLVKFAVFFIFVFPYLSEMEGLRKSQFASFFVAYSVSMITEVFYLIRYLNRQS